MAEFGVETHSKQEIIDITSSINSRVPKNMSCGVCHIFCSHTTAGVTVNENADPNVKHDILKKLDAMIPDEEKYYRHQEGNSAAHVKAVLTGQSVSVPVKNGALQLGLWQGVYFCEYDGPRFRRVKVLFQNAEE